MGNREEKQLRAWVQAWQQADKELTEMKLKELREPNYYKKNMFILNELLKISVNRPNDSKSSGLIELQRWFKVIHKKRINSG